MEKNSFQALGLSIKECSQCFYFHQNANISGIDRENCYQIDLIRPLVNLRKT